MVETSYMGTWTLGADNATVRNVPGPGAGSIQARRPIPQLSRINAIRFDGKSIYHGVTVRSERRMAGNYAYNASYTLSSSKDDASSPGPTESEANVPQNVRNIFSDTAGFRDSELRPDLQRKKPARNAVWFAPELLMRREELCRDGLTPQLS
jgi:hypothetical protein